MKKLLFLLLLAGFLFGGMPNANHYLGVSAFAADEDSDDGYVENEKDLKIKKGEAGIIFIKQPHYCDGIILHEEGTTAWVNTQMCGSDNYIIKVDPKSGDKTFLGSLMWQNNAYGAGKRQALFYALPAGHHEFFVYSPDYKFAKIKGRMMKGDFEAGKLYYILVESIDSNDVDETATLDDMGLRFHFFTKDSEYKDDLLKWTSKRVYWQEPKKKLVKAYNKNIEDIKAHYDAVKNDKSRMIEMPKGYGLPLSQYLYKKAPIINRLETE